MTYLTEGHVDLAIISAGGQASLGAHASGGLDHRLRRESVLLALSRRTAGTGRAAAEETSEQSTGLLGLANLVVAGTARLGGVEVVLLTDARGGAVRGPRGGVCLAHEHIDRGGGIDLAAALGLA